MPRYLRETRPGSDHLVLEVDPLLVEISEDELGLDLGDDIEVATGDARLSIRDAGEDRVRPRRRRRLRRVCRSPGTSPPSEFLRDLEATMTDDGVLVLNVIDYGPRDFLRAELATVGAVFDHVAVLGPPSRFGPRDQPDGGNVVVVASQTPLDLGAVLAANVARGGDAVALHGDALERFVGEAPVLTDDRSPVDQLLTPLPTT